MDKLEILRKIKLSAERNGGTPLGSARFEDETGIKESDWFGKYWRNWGDAVREAGLSPNQMQAPFDEDFLFTALLELTRELERLPVKGDLLLKRRRDPTFPSHNVFYRRFGSKRQCVAKLTEYCDTHPGFDDVAAILSRTALGPRSESSDGLPAGGTIGYVYLFRHGSRHEYKIGKTNNPIRREGEIAIELPERVQPIHVIATDDPSGIEEYWHRRFTREGKAMNGEWFKLSAEDVRTFKRWRKIF
jgi:hypothetical protein